MNRRSSRIVSAAASLALALGLACVSVGEAQAITAVPADAQPEYPPAGIPADPVVAWSGGFSSSTGPGNGSNPVAINDYVSAPVEGYPDGFGYTADPWWLPSANLCNGWVLNATTPSPTALDAGCQANGGRDYTNSAGNLITNTANITSNGQQRYAWDYLRYQAYVLGLAQGMVGGALPADPDPTVQYAMLNNVLAAETNGTAATGFGSTQLETTSATKATPGHYYTMQALFASMHCNREVSTWYDPSQNLNLVLGNGEVYPVGVGMDPCTLGNDLPGFDPYPASNPAPFAAHNIGGNSTSAAGAWYPGPVGVAQLSGNVGYQAKVGDTLGFSVENTVNQTTGNDIAFDLPQIIDITPRLDKSFTPQLISPDGISTLAFTVTNTTDLLAKPGFNFTDTLPVGVTIASPPNITSTCANWDYTVNELGYDDVPGSISFGGDLQLNEEFCTFFVDVTVTSQYIEDAKIDVTETAHYFFNSVATDIACTGSEPSCTWGLVGNPSAPLVVKLPVLKIDIAPPIAQNEYDGSTTLTWLISIINATNYDQNTESWYDQFEPDTFECNGVIDDDGLCVGEWQGTCSSGVVDQDGNCVDGQWELCLGVLDGDDCGGEWYDVCTWGFDADGNCLGPLTPECTGELNDDGECLGEWEYDVCLGLAEVDLDGTVYCIGEVIDESLSSCRLFATGVPQVPVAIPAFETPCPVSPQEVQDAAVTLAPGPFQTSLTWLDPAAGGSELLCANQLTNGKPNGDLCFGSLNDGTINGDGTANTVWFTDLLAPGDVEQLTVTTTLTADATGLSYQAIDNALLSSEEFSMIAMINSPSYRSCTGSDCQVNDVDDDPTRMMSLMHDYDRWDQASIVFPPGEIDLIKSAYAEFPAESGEYRPLDAIHFDNQLVWYQVIATNSGGAPLQSVSAQDSYVSPTPTGWVDIDCSDAFTTPFDTGLVTPNCDTEILWPAEQSDGVLPISMAWPQYPYQVGEWTEDYLSGDNPDDACPVENQARTEAQPIYFNPTYDYFGLNPVAAKYLYPELVYSGPSDPGSELTLQCVPLWQPTLPVTGYGLAEAATRQAHWVIGATITAGALLVLARKARAKIGGGPRE